MQNTLPILIVGAGPTGLTMAIELSRQGIPFRIIDKQIKPVLHSNALAVQTRTLYVWEDLGLLQDAHVKGEEVKAFNVYSDHKKLAHIDTKLLEGNKKYILGLSQHETETMLLKNLRDKNVIVEMEVDITDLQENATGIKVSLQHKDGGTEEINTQWLIACDGGHSFVREKIGIPFTGKELRQHFVLADAEIESTLAHINRVILQG